MVLFQIEFVDWLGNGPGAKIAKWKMLFPLWCDFVALGDFVDWLGNGPGPKIAKIGLGGLLLGLHFTYPV